MANCNCTLAVVAALIGCFLGAVIVGFAIFFAHMTMTLTAPSRAAAGELPENDQQDKEKVRDEPGK